MTTDPTESGVDRILLGMAVQGMWEGAVRQTNYLREGFRTPPDRFRGRHLLRQSSLNLSEEQLQGIENAILQCELNLLGWLLSVIDGASQPDGWPSTVRLVDTADGRVVGNERLKWTLTAMLDEFLAARGRSLP